jgi:hypothetical protein
VTPHIRSLLITLNRFHVTVPFRRKHSPIDSKGWMTV